MNRGDGKEACLSSNLQLGKENSRAACPVPVRPRLPRDARRQAAAGSGLSAASAAKSPAI